MGLSLEMRPQDRALPPVSPPPPPFLSLWVGIADSSCARIPLATALAGPFFPPGTQWKALLTQCPTRTAWSPVAPQLRDPGTRPGDPWMPPGPGLTPGGPSGPRPRPSAELLLPPDSLKARLGGLSPVRPLQGRRQPTGWARGPPGTAGPQVPLWVLCCPRVSTP